MQNSNMFLKRLKVIQTLLDVSIKVFVVFIPMIYIAKVNEFNK
jgi:hypothetical protein